MLAHFEGNVEIGVFEWGGLGEQWGPILVHWTEEGLGPHISTLRAIHEIVHTSLESWLSWLHGAYRVLCV